MTSLAETVLEACRTKGWTIATAESCTGGLIIGALTDIAGSSDVVDRGFITYSNQAKMDMLAVSNATLNSYGAVSEQIAAEMAEGALSKSECQIAISVTGIAGPGGSEHKPEGRVCFGLCVKGKMTKTETVEFGAVGRSNVRLSTVTHALGLIVDAAKE